MKFAVLDVNPMARNKIFMALLMSLPKLMNVLLILLLLLILYSLTLRAVDLLTPSFGGPISLDGSMGSNGKKS